MNPPNKITKKHNSEGNSRISSEHIIHRNNNTNTNMNMNMNMNMNSIPALKPSTSSSSDHSFSPQQQQQQQQYSQSPTSTFDEEQDLNLFVSDLLDQMTSKFEHMGKSIISRIDDMGGRIDTLEQSITDLLDVQVQVQGQGVERFDQHSHSHSHSNSHSNFESNDKSRLRHLNVIGPGLNMNQTSTARTNDE